MANAALRVVHFLVFCIIFLPVFGEGLDKHEERSKAKARLREVCQNTAEYPFLKCRPDPRNPSDFHYLGGTFGMGVVAEVINNPAKYGIVIYSDARVISPFNAKDLVVNISDASLVSPQSSPSIMVFLKTAQYGKLPHVVYEHQEDAFDLEKRRSRVLAGQSLAPAVYDVLRNSEPLLSDDFYMTEFLDAENVFDMTQSIAKDLLAVMEYGLPDVVNAAKRNRANFRRLLQLFSFEVWLRIRSFYMLVDAALGLAARLWRRGYRHCDLHPGNIMILKHTVPVESSLFTTFIRDGRGIAPYSLKGLNLASIRSLRSQLQQKGIEEVEFFVLHPRYIRVIDLAYLINIRSFKSSENEVHLSTPCRLKRPSRQEDIVELRRVVMHVSAQSQKIKASWSQIRAANELNLLGKQPATRPLVKAIDAEVQKALALLSELDALIKENPPWTSCNRNNKEFIRLLSATSRDKRSAMKAAFSQRTSYRCSVADEEKALELAKHLLDGLANEVDKRLPADFSIGLTALK